jgi:hypothetical protein
MCTVLYCHLNCMVQPLLWIYTQYVYVLHQIFASTWYTRRNILATISYAVYIYTGTAHSHISTTRCCCIIYYRTVVAASYVAMYHDDHADRHAMLAATPHWPLSHAGHHAILAATLCWHPRHLVTLLCWLQCRSGFTTTLNVRSFWPPCRTILALKPCRPPCQVVHHTIPVAL